MENYRVALNYIGKYNCSFFWIVPASASYKLDIEKLKVNYEMSSTSTNETIK